MTSRFTAMSGYLTGLFSQSPNRASSSISQNRDDKENQRVAVDTNAVAGPSTFGCSPGQKHGLAVLEDKIKMDDSLICGVELDLSMAMSAGGDQQAIHSSGFYGQARPDRATAARNRRNRDKRDKGKAREVPHIKPSKRVMEDSFQPVRVYRCPASDRPMYTLDMVNHTITIHATDADPSYWPSVAQQRSTTASTSSAPEAYSNGGVDQQPSSSPSKKKDWHEPVNSETKQYLAWKKKCGYALATMLDLEGDPKLWKLANWPDGYKMFIKHQYQNQYSFFHYIIGSTFLGTRRFTTAKEYSKHLYWLCTFGHDIHARCKCRFCAREYEKDQKARTAIIQRCIRVPHTEDMPPPLKKPRYTLSAAIPSTGMHGNRTRLTKPTVEIPLPASTVPGSVRNSVVKLTGNELPSTAPPSLVSSALPLVTAAGGLFSKMMGYATAPSISATTTVPPAESPTRSDILVQKKGRKGGRPLGPTNAGVAAKQKPVVEIEQASQTGASATTMEARATTSIATISDTSNLGKRKRAEVNYFIESLENIEAAERLAAAAVEAELANGNGRAVRSTRNQKSMKESPPPRPLGPMYSGPFIHRKRHDDLAIHSAPYREHEIVWHKLDKVLVCPSNENLQIAYWPCEIISKTLKIKTHHVEIVSIVDMNGDPMDIPQPVNMQYYVYTVELLGLESGSNTFECRVEELLPWVACCVPDALRGPQAANLLKRKDTLLKSLDSEEEMFESMLTTWAWARHWADAVRSQFSPFGLFFDNETIKKMRRRKRGYYFNGTSKKKKTRAEKEAREKEMIREVELIEGNIQQYQGIWLGSEKVWVGDMVRLAGTLALPPSSQPDGTTEIANTAHLQLYRGKSLRDGKGQLVKLDGYHIHEESVHSPAFFQITHIYRVPGENGEAGTLQFDGTFYELVREEGETVKKPPSLYGDMQGTLDSSDTSTSSTTDQHYVVDPVTGAKALDNSISNLYKRGLVPPPPLGYTFKRLKKLSGAADDEGATGLPPFMIAGRYYNSDVLFPDANDPQTRKLIRSTSGKTYRPETQMKPTHWIPNRRVMIRASRKRATKDMQIFFDEREKKERIAKENERRRLANAEIQISDDDDDGPMVSTTRASQSDSHTKAKRPKNTISKATTVADDSDEDSDIITVATTEA